MKPAPKPTKAQREWIVEAYAAASVSNRDLVEQLLMMLVRPLRPAPGWKRKDGDFVNARTAERDARLAREIAEYERTRTHDLVWVPRTDREAVQ